MNLAFEYAKQFAEKHWEMVEVYGVKQGQCECGSPECKAPGKHPVSKNWTEKGTTDLNLIYKWFNKPIQSNYGLLTGKHFCVIDVDKKNGGIEYFNKIQVKHSRFPDTPVVNSGGGGFHLYVKPTPNLSNAIHVQIENVSTDRVDSKTGIDIKGAGGLIIGPGSTHYSGKKYDWDAVLNFDSCDLVDCPSWFFNNKKINNTTFLETSKGLQKNNYIIKAGYRHTMMTKIFGHLLAKNVNFHLAVELLTCLNQSKFHPPLDEDEFEKIIDGIAMREVKKRLEALK